MMSLTRYLSLIVGDLPTSSFLQKECSGLLQTLVAEHHDLYIKFSKLDLKPKYNFMVHYHTMMTKFGPCNLRPNTEYQ